MIAYEASTNVMQIYLDKFSETIAPDEHVVMAMDQAGWHGSHALKVPKNMTLEMLPARSPQLNPVERFWLYLKQKIPVASFARRRRRIGRRRLRRLEPNDKRAKTPHIFKLLSMDHKLRQYIGGLV